MNELGNQAIQIETDETEIDELTQIKSSQTGIRRNKPGTPAQVGSKSKALNKNIFKVKIFNF